MDGCEHRTAEGEKENTQILIVLDFKSPPPSRRRLCADSLFLMGFEELSRHATQAACLRARAARSILMAILSETC